MSSFSVPTRWVLDEALEIIRALQPESRRFGYHLCLGGGVLNKGESDKDLDLYFLPLGNQHSNPRELVSWLSNMWGTPRDMAEDYPDEPPYLERLKFMYGQLRVDVFVLGVQQESDQESDKPLYCLDDEIEFEESVVPARPHPDNWAGMYLDESPNTSVYQGIPREYPNDQPQTSTTTYSVSNPTLRPGQVAYYNTAATGPGYWEPVGSGPGKSESDFSSWINRYLKRGSTNPTSFDPETTGPGNLPDSPEG